jgi:CMP-N,N'-diacetyllegionaminic acid synthase
MKKGIILGIIPARSGSKRLKNKNIKLLLGRPLIAYTIQAGLKSKLLDKLIVSTDSLKIADIARKYKAEIPFIRPKILAKDNTPMTAVLKHAVRQVEKKSGQKVALIVLLQPSSPLRKKEDIDYAINKIIKTKADSLVSVCRLENTANPYLIKKVKAGRLYPYLKCGQQMKQQARDTLYRLNGALYLVKRDILMRKNTLYGSDTRTMIMDKNASVDIDTECDFFTAAALLRKNKKCLNR